MQTAIIISVVVILIVILYLLEKKKNGHENYNRKLTKDLSSENEEENISNESNLIQSQLPNEENLNADTKKSKLRVLIVTHTGRHYFQDDDGYLFKKVKINKITTTNHLIYTYLNVVEHLDGNLPTGSVKEDSYRFHDIVNPYEYRPENNYRSSIIHTTEYSSNYGIFCQLNMNGQQYSNYSIIVEYFGYR